MDCEFGKPEILEGPTQTAYVSVVRARQSDTDPERDPVGGGRQHTLVPDPIPDPPMRAVWSIESIHASISASSTGSRVRCCCWLDEGGARLCPSSIATRTLQTFPAASRSPVSRLPEVLRPPQGRRLRAAPLAGPTPSASADAARLIQGCSHPAPARPGPGCPQLLSDRCDGQTMAAAHPSNSSASRRTRPAPQGLRVRLPAFCK
jgi:hypothetical protein